MADHAMASQSQWPARRSPRPAAVPDGGVPGLALSPLMM